jgi:hypothetical protein
MKSVESNLTIQQLFLNGRDNTSIDAATNLWDAIRPDDVFNPSIVSISQYREEVLLPAFAVEEEKYNAFEVTCLMSKKLTNIRGHRKDMILPLFKNALNTQHNNRWRLR